MIDPVGGNYTHKDNSMRYEWLGIVIIIVVGVIALIILKQNHVF